MISTQISMRKPHPTHRTAPYSVYSPELCWNLKIPDFRSFARPAYSNRPKIDRKSGPCKGQHTKKTSLFPGTEVDLLPARPEVKLQDLHPNTQSSASRFVRHPKFWFKKCKTEPRIAKVVIRKAKAGKDGGPADGRTKWKDERGTKNESKFWTRLGGTDSKRKVVIVEDKRNAEKAQTSRDQVSGRVGRRTTQRGWQNSAQQSGEKGQYATHSQSIATARITSFRLLSIWIINKISKPPV